MTKQQRNNRANQLNPNNGAYYKSRMGAHSGSGKKVVHHHHHHHHSSKGAGTRCPVCGGNHLKVTFSGAFTYFIECKTCGAEFSKSK